MPHITASKVARSNMFIFSTVIGRYKALTIFVLILLKAAIKLGNKGLNNSIKKAEAIVQISTDSPWDDACRIIGSIEDILLVSNSVHFNR
jgi:hypothetical protein